MGVQTDSSQQPSILSNMLSALQAILTDVWSTLISMLDQIIPPPRRAAIYSRACAFGRNRPILASFLAFQLVCSGVPLSLLILHVASVIFFSFATAIVIGSICALTFTAVCVGLALLVLVPILMVTTFVGLTLWFWALAGWYVLGWMGLLERRRAPATKAGEENEKGAIDLVAVKEVSEEKN
ncbi:hypothetical protein PRK78_001901 [Emydomyces testavorans]|uniref:Uncharacterized protein n=1 Tax=Emydomyces testavorans TaxID=2070801 RepID=A0AAF0IH44_9EURO|nr:hypothetical protein PRK78_001901 [Emydomyces testavorans]